MTRRLTLDDLWRIPYALDPQRSPDGERVAYGVRTSDRATDANVTRLWTVSAGGGAPAPLTAGPADSAPRWSPDGRALAYLSAPDGGPPQIWTVPAGGGPPRRATSLAHGVASAPAWSPDGRSIAFVGAELDGSSGDRRAPHVFDELPTKADGAGWKPRGLALELYVVSAAGGEARRLTDLGRASLAPAWSPDGTRIAFTSVLDDAGVEAPTAAAFVVPAAGGDAVQLTDDGRFHSFVVWTPDGASLVTVAADSRTLGQPTLLVTPAGGGEPRALAPRFDCAVRLRTSLRPATAAPAFSPDGRLVFVARDRSRDHVFAADPASGEVVELVGGERRAVSGLSVTRAGIAFVGVTPETTGEVCVAALDGTGERTLTTLFADALGDVEPFVPEERTFTAPDGQQLHGWLIRGGGPQPAPLLLDVHGGPADSWGPGFDGAELYEQVLAADGWNVLRLNARGSDGYGAAFRDALVGRWGIADEPDFHAALDALVAEGVADPQRVAVGGYSYGGFVACWLTARSDRFAAAVTGGTVVNLLSICGTADAGAHIVGVAFGAHPYHEHLGALLERSPISHASGVRAPTLILQGERDVACTVDQAEQWFTALRAQGRTARLVVYPQAFHGFVDTGPPSQRLDYNRQWVEWLQRHAGGAPR